MCCIAVHIKDVSTHVNMLFEATLEVLWKMFLSRVSSLRKGGLAETVVPGFHVDSDGASSVLVLDLVCVCVLLFVGCSVVLEPATTAL